MEPSLTESNMVATVLACAQLSHSFSSFRSRRVKGKQVKFAPLLGTVRATTAGTSRPIRISANVPRTVLAPMVKSASPGSDVLSSVLRAAR